MLCKLKLIVHTATITILVIIILCFMGLGSSFFDRSSVPDHMHIVGWNCDKLIYEDHKRNAYELGEDGHYYPVGKNERRLK